MFVKIYGKEVGCKFCDRAKTICELNGYDMEFIDIVSEGMGAAELSEICGTPVRSVPQIFIDEQYIGGCDKFEEYLKQE